MSQDEFFKFDEWYQYTINGGDLPFDIQVQDDSGDLAWLTAKGLDEYQASCINGFDWKVSWKVRSIEPLYYGRVPLPFSGRTTIGLQATGELLVLKPLYGATSLGITSGTVYVPPPPPAASALLGLTNVTGQLGARPFWGATIVGITATGRFFDLGESELILKFDDVSWTPPDGDDVTLQFDNVPYVPPSV